MSSSPQPGYLSGLGRRLHAPVISGLMKTALENPGIMSLAAGFTDTSTLPVDIVGRVVEKLRATTQPPEHLQYGAPQGRQHLREQLVERTRRHDEGCPLISAERTMIGNVSQQLLYMAVQMLCDPGDIVLVERPTYFVFLEMLSGLGVQAVPLPVTKSGEYDLDAIDGLFRDLKSEYSVDRIKAVYMMGYFANPSGISRSTREKTGLAAAMRKHDLMVPILEDGAYRELWYDEPWEARSVMALEEFEGFPRLFFGTLTKPFATGLKIGYVHASDDAVFERLLWLKGHHDFGTANFNQAILEAILADGHLDPFLDDLRRAYARKMDTLDRSLEANGLRELGWTWQRPTGGLYIWARAPEGVSTAMDETMWKACVREKVMYVPGGLCLAGKVDSRNVRLSFGVLDQEGLGEAAARFARAAESSFPAKTPVS